MTIDVTKIWYGKNQVSFALGQGNTPLEFTDYVCSEDKVFKLPDGVFHYGRNGYGHLGIFDFTGYPLKLYAQYRRGEWVPVVYVDYPDEHCARTFVLEEV